MTFHKISILLRAIVIIIVPGNVDRDEDIFRLLAQKRIIEVVRELSELSHYLSVDTRSTD